MASWYVPAHHPQASLQSLMGPTEPSVPQTLEIRPEIG
jgi:hypothetical protein